SATEGAEDTVRSNRLRERSNIRILRVLSGGDVTSTIPTRDTHMRSRRQLLKALGAACGVVLAKAGPFAQGVQPQGTRSLLPNPPRYFGPNPPPTIYFNDPDVLVVDPEFGGLVQANSAIKRLWSGALWCEGPAWSAEGRYLLWSDIPNNRQLRWLEDD